MPGTWQIKYFYHPACFPVRFWPMPGRAFPTFTDQAAERLRQGVVEGRWRGMLPCRALLARDPGVTSPHGRFMTIHGDIQFGPPLVLNPPVSINR